MKKERIVLYVMPGEGAEAKKGAAELRKRAHAVQVLDAQAFLDKENVDRVIFSPNVPEELEVKIREAYGDSVVYGNEEAPNPEEIEIPEDWESMSWQKQVKLAQQLAPDGVTIRNKEEAVELIKKTIAENE